MTTAWYHDTTSIYNLYDLYSVIIEYNLSNSDVVMLAMKRKLRYFP